MRCSPTPSPCAYGGCTPPTDRSANADAYSKLVDDTVYEVDCQMIVVKEGDVDIGA